MTREEEIYFIKENLQIEDIAEEFGLIQIKKNSRVIRYKSPADERYELVVFRKNNRFVDYGSGARGSVIDFYMYINSMNYIQAIQELRDIAGLNDKEHFEIKRKRNDFKLAEKEFQELLRVYISNCKNKTKYLLELRDYIRGMKNRIAKEEFNLNNIDQTA